MTNNEDNIENINKKQSIKRLLLLTVPHLKGIIIAAVLVLLVNASELIKPYILKIVIDSFLMKGTAGKGIYSITGMGIIYFSVVVLGNLFSYTEINIINRTGQEIIRDLRNKVFNTIQYLPLWYLDRTSSGRLITRATNDVEAVSEMYTDVIISLFQDVFLLIGIVYTMISLNVRLALVSFSMIPVIFFIVFLLKKKIKKNFARMKSLIGAINGFMSENISGMKIVQIFRAEKEKKKEFTKLNNEYFNATLFQVWLNSFMKPAADVFQSLSIAILIWYGMGKVSNHTLEIGVLYAFTSYIKQFFDPISDIADNYTTIQSALVSADRIFDIIDQKPNVENLDEGISLNKMEGNIEFKNVWFSYDNENWILKDISFNINKGQTAAFVGETGAGKTTIISLISGFYEIQKGEILIDGVNINSIKKRELRRQVAVVLQDVFLFSGTIESNLTLNDKIDKDVVLSSLKTCCADGFVKNLDNGILEPVAERGSTFSAGQRQLLSFARAIAHEPSIFVLDEATANIDTHTEKLIQKAIENVKKDRTTLIIAHRLSTIRNADKIIVIKHGEVVESGNHSELVRKNGYYKKMLDESTY